MLGEKGGSWKSSRVRANQVTPLCYNTTAASFRLQYKVYMIALLDSTLLLLDPSVLFSFQLDYLKRLIIKANNPSIKGLEVESQSNSPCTVRGYLKANIMRIIVMKRNKKEQKIQLN